MKKTGRILCLAVLIMTMTASLCFGAESLELVKSYPDAGQKNTTKENMGVKLWFNNDMGSEESQKANEGCFEIVDDEGKKLPIKVFYNPKDSKEVMVLVDATKRVKIKDNTTYNLNIDENLQDNAGNALGKDQTISFTTLNQKKNQNVYMVMMLVMFVGMFAFSSFQMKRQSAEKKEDKEEPFNPYKEAKKQGKSVDEVIAQHEKDMEKKAAKEAREAKRAHRRKEDEEETAEEEDNGNYRVKAPRPIAAAGSTYVTGRKAAAEACRAEEERLAKRRANAKKKKKK